jgi:hypothetical protein
LSEAKSRQAAFFATFNQALRSRRAIWASKVRDSQNFRNLLGEVTRTEHQSATELVVWRNHRKSR